MRYAQSTIQFENVTTGLSRDSHLDTESQGARFNGGNQAEKKYNPWGMKEGEGDSGLYWCICRSIEKEQGRRTDKEKLWCCSRDGPL